MRREKDRCIIYLSKDPIPPTIKELISNNYELIIIKGNSIVTEGNEYVLTYEFLGDVLSIIKLLLKYDEVRVISNLGNSYLITLIALATSVIYDKIHTYLTRQGSMYVSIVPSITHALSGREAMYLRLRIIEEVGKLGCLSINELSSKLGLSKATMIRHIYTLSKSRLIRKYNDRVCRSFNSINDT